MGAAGLERVIRREKSLNQRLLRVKLPIVAAVQFLLHTIGKEQQQCQPLSYVITALRQQSKSHFSAAV